MKIDFQYAWSQLINNWPLFWYGIKMTIAFAVVGTLAGLIIQAFMYGYSVEHL